MKLLLLFILSLSFISLTLSLKSIQLKKLTTYLNQAWEHYYDTIDGFGADHIIEDNNNNIRGRRISSMV